MIARLLPCIALLAFGVQAEEFTYTLDDDSGNNIALGFPPPEPFDTTTPGAYFRSYDYLHARHQELVIDNPEWLRHHEVGHTWKDRAIHAYRFGDLDDLTLEDNTPEAAVLINASIHAREWQTQEAITGLMEHLVAIRDDNGIGRYLADNLDIFILPIQNIDGFLQSQHHWNKVTQSEQQPRDGRMRRKNMHAPDDSAVDDSLATLADNLHGVDLNRNGKYGFGAPNDSSSDVASLVYKGAAAASEPETHALLNLAEMIPPGRLRFFEDLHSYSQLMFVPQLGDEVRDEIARALAYGMSNAVGGHYEVFPDPVGSNIGAMSDYFAGEYKVPSWTLELEPHYLERATQYGGIGVSHDGFIMPESEVPRLRDEYNRMHIAVFYEMAGPAIVQEIEIRRLADGAIMFAADWQANSDSARRMNVTTDRTLQPDTEYELWVAFSKPMHADAVDDSRRGDVHLVDLDGNAQIVVTEPEWLDQPGGAFQGYRRYRHDAFRATFILPPDLPADGSAERRMLSIAASDFARRQPDADPATIADFVDGRWINWEWAPLIENEGPQYGNLDCNFTISVGKNPDDVAAPVGREHCRDFLHDEPPSHGAPSGSSGGGAATLLLLLVVSSQPRRRSIRA